MESRIASLERQMADLVYMSTQLRDDLTQAVQNVEAAKITFADATGLKLAEHEMKMQGLFEETKRKFQEVDGSLGDSFSRTAASVAALEAQVNNIERGRRGGEEGGNGSYLPRKQMIPQIYSNKPDDWRAWTEDVADWLDSICDGLKDLLREAGAEEDDIGEDWHFRKRQEGVYTPQALDRVKLWRSLKKLTDGEARKVIASVTAEDGYRAWQKLKQRFEPGLQAKRGQVLLELNSMIINPAKSPAEFVT